MGLFADIGLPMISLILPIAWLLLVPIIVIEALVGVRIAKVPFRHTLSVTAAANFFSTILGIPLAWLTMALIEGVFFGEAKGIDSFWAKVYAVTIQSPWLIPYEEDLIWMIPIATVVLAIPLWMMSVVSEYFIVKCMLPDLPASVTWQWTWKANVVSYVLLLAVIAALPVLEPVVGWGYLLLCPVTDFLVGVVMKIAELF